MRKPKREFELIWVFEPFERDSTFCTRRMFGALAAYLQGRMVMLLAEDPGEKSYRGKKYPFDIWNGILLPTFREHHASLNKDFSALKQHPVLGKWLYLPLTEEDFESTVREIGDLIAQGDERFGIEPNLREEKKEGWQEKKHIKNSRQAIGVETMQIREALESDLADVLAVERAAFGREDESLLVAKLLKDVSAKPTLSLLAYEEDNAVGHILFTKARLESKLDVSVYLLAPLAVRPNFQKQGIGEGLIKHSLKSLSDLKVDLVFVLGYPDYYRRHGFEAAGKYGLEATYPIPPKNSEAWRVMALSPDILGKFKGKVICADKLNKPEYWRE